MVLWSGGVGAGLAKATDVELAFGGRNEMGGSFVFRGEAGTHSGEVKGGQGGECVGIG